MTRTGYIIAGKLAVTAITIGVLSRSLDLTAVFDTVAGFEVSGIPIILVLLGSGLAISALKWQLILRGLGRVVAFTDLARLSWIGLFFNTFLPGRTGGDIVRAWGLAATDENRLRSVASVVLDRGLNLFALLLIGAAATVFDSRIPVDLAYVVQLAALAVSILSVLLFLIRRSVMRYFPFRVQQLLRTLDTGRWTLRRGTTVIILAIAFQMLVVLINLVAARGLGITISAAALFVAIPLTAIVTAIPISVNGIGVREAAYATILSYLGADSEVAVALSLSVTAAMILWSLGGGAVFALSSLTVTPKPVGESNGAW